MFLPCSIRELNDDLCFANSAEAEDGDLAKLALNKHILVNDFKLLFTTNK